VTLRIVVPDGALRAPSLELFAAAGFGGPDRAADDGVAAARADDDSVVAAVRAVDDGAVDGLDARFTVVAPADVAAYLSSGAADAGLIAKDVLLEHATRLCVLLDLRFGAGQLVYAVAPGAEVRAERLGRLRIATRHPTLTRTYFRARGLQVSVVNVDGTLDRAVTDGLADGVVTLVEATPTGSPPAGVAGLTVAGVVAETTIRLVAGRGARVLHGAELGVLVAGLRDLIADRSAP
jgi:ATP phosphoribosyltransferase